MIKPFKGDFKLTQGFGGNKEAYQKYGLIGHNGLDHAVPCATPLYAMISGIIKEVADEGNIGYGKYVKIENEKEGALVAHLSKFSNIKVGDFVSEGNTQIGWSGTSGNSIGCHTHTGYYRFPRDRQNGYSGYIDPTPFINTTPTEGGKPVNPIQEKKAGKLDQLVRKMNSLGIIPYDNTERYLDNSDLENAIQKLIENQGNPETQSKLIKAKELGRQISEL